MSTIVTRSGKGSPLSHVEVDANFNNLNTDKVEKTAAAITGGTINGTTVGATTPAAGTFTTITGQTEVLKGTGSNLVTQSQTFNTTWTQTAVTTNQTATTAPNGTSTGNSVTPTVANSIHRIQNVNIPVASGIVYTVSVYAKANGYSKLYLNCTSAINANKTFDLSNQTISGTGGGTATITDAGNGWYRCAITATATATTASGSYFLQVNNAQAAAADETFTGDGTSGLFLWGAQFEIGSTANTYIPTTTTAIYGTPTLSFSGVSEIGLLSNGALYLQPAGTGALQAQATTSTTAGGNARGANAVDWQTLRVNATEVASGSYSIVGGGQRNTASGSYSQSLGGYNNSSSAFESVIVGGQTNGASGQISFIGGGTSNITSGYASTIVGGTLNTGAGLYNFIGAGQLNSGTSGSAVTTQSGTMNATTAVTLSGSNANIKVGQYISGTSIGTDTYVAAISGTALTLSKVASGSSTSTLSFFTPHGVVVGGGNNQATGSYSFIGGGGDAGTAANRNVASGDWSFVGGGTRNTASAIGSFVGGGGTFGGGIIPNNASATASSVVGGVGNNATGFITFVGGGSNNTANGTASSICGGNAGTTRSISGYLAFPACDTPVSVTFGSSQAALLVLGTQTTDATATALRSNTSVAGTTNQVILPNNSAYFFTGEVVSGVTGGGNTKGWTIEGVIKRGANAASTALVGTPTVVSTYSDAGAATWALAVTADTTNGGIRVTFTGQASTTIRTVARISTVEMTY